jgi:hypothetical protein
MTTKKVKVTFKKVTYDLPAGLRVKPITPYPTQTRPLYWLDQLPEELFPLGSIQRHDAIHYGLVLEANQVQ